ncbi:putative metal-binding motif-containing protein [Stigmatella erecta]|uniref:Putative metal-binding motif-containing protein n=1 Tax=Stigmatella erecta TaxID=83460 RepID=A0A1H9ZNP5_9BACT|nr:putative metal-binding motif-containing protein [Stigmatella erecta]SES83282.1 Putative metal-binding motif-containing protein [Stigmatella erecta]
MRLFLFGLWFVTLAACKSEDRREGAIRVDLSYATFRPGCLTLTASDKADPSRSTEQVLSVLESADGRVPRSQDLTVAVYRQDDWSHELTITAEASEADCKVEDRRSVAIESVDVRVPEEGIEVVRLDLRATDLDDDGFVVPVDGRGTDCDDANPAVKPGAVDLACTTAQECAGTFSCTAQGVATTCMSTQPFTTWYTDVDGDGRAGTSVGDDCKPPVEGAVTVLDDCDDNSPFAFTDAVERCDRVDNNCNKQVDETGCGSMSWSTVPLPGDPETRWRAVTAYAEGHVWVVGDNGRVIHVAGSSGATEYTNCAGNWISAWARPSDGRVFLGSTGGVFGSHKAADSDCGGTPSGSMARLNGLVGFEDATGTVLFAVNSEGRIYRWVYTKAPTEVFTAGFSLRAIHGTKISNMLAVGSHDGSPKVFGVDADGNWIPETLPTGLPADTTLRSVHVVHDGLAFAAGDNGVVLQRSRDGWTRLPGLGNTPPDIQGLTAYGPTTVYVAATDSTLKWYNGKDWASDVSGSWTPTAIGGVGPHEIWAVGDKNTLLRWRP